MGDPARRGLLAFDRRLERSFVDRQCRAQVTILAEEFSEDLTVLIRSLLRDLEMTTPVL
jgi:hypothetical protein